MRAVVMGAELWTWPDGMTTDENREGELVLVSTTAPSSGQSLAWRG